MAPMFIPGPVDVADEVMQAQMRPMLPHRSAEFEEIFHRTEGNSRKLLKTENRVFITASSGTGIHEAAVRNFANSKVLACVNGAFGSRWHDVAVSNGKDVTKLETDWQEPITAELVADALKEGGYEIVLVVHNETSTGLMNPIQEIAQAVQATSPDTLVCIDAVSSASGANIETDAWGLDLVLTSSQKALALPPGLGLAAVSDRAMQRAEGVEQRGWYFDFLRLEKHRTSNSTPATPAIGLIYALDVQLDRIFAEGLENRFKRHIDMAQVAQEWAIDKGLALYAPEGYRSQTVSTIDNTQGIDVGALNAFLMERDMRIAGGYGPIKARTFRIGHMGELTAEDVGQLTKAIDEFLEK
ncbi:MAG: alanine--glyoxylate aminotransferase family protein [Chloroflexi bacterium]|nr:MAG: alanine--glyoxylate aminotransferase family protein [Chloroflexota bacterium]MBL1194416.1 alanine--glyoxylate aminotransferase family protein [Chloroflexota bacterium]NOH11704.1 alanine--glyoxylate aminotransferase family protein [Chloroflexota bacterium]